MICAILVSAKDPAGMSIREALITTQQFQMTDERFDEDVIYVHQKTSTKLCTLASDSIHAEHVDKRVFADAFIFATKHQSAKGVSCFCVHAPGNFSAADAGGKPRTLCGAMSKEMRRAQELLRIDTPSGLPVLQEATHHGPQLDKPVLFIEIGSNDQAWRDKTYAEHIAKVIITLLNEKKDEKIPNYKEHIVIGGLHYNYVADKLNRSKGFCVGHICPKHLMDSLDEQMINETVQKSASGEHVTFVFDWKGASSAKTRNGIISILENKQLAWVRSDRYFKETVD